MTNVDLDTSVANIPTTANIRRESAGTWTGLCGRGAGGNAKGKSRPRSRPRRAYLITVIMRARMLTVVIRRVIGRWCITARVELPISSRPLIIDCYAKIHIIERERKREEGMREKERKSEEGKESEAERISWSRSIVFITRLLDIDIRRISRLHSDRKIFFDWDIYALKSSKNLIAKLRFWI